MTAPKTKRWTCTRCGARKSQTAETKCKPHRDYSDEWTCPADGVEEDKEGNFIVPKGYKA